MKLVINNCDDIQFIKYLIKLLRKQLLGSIVPGKLIKWDNYLNTLPIFKTKYKKGITAKEIIYSAAFNIRYMKSGQDYTIYIDNNQKIFGTNAKLYSICKLINYGNMQMQGYPIFTNTFNYIADNIQILYLRYQRGFK